MPYLIEQQRQWIVEHGRKTSCGGWVCKKTGAPINAKEFTEYLGSPCCGINDFLRGDDGNRTARKVLALYCTACGKEPKKQPAGDVVEVAA